MFGASPRLRLWHLAGIVAACAGFLAIERLREPWRDPRAHLMRLAGSGGADERIGAIVALAGSGDTGEGVVDALLRASGHEDARVREAAARCLWGVVARMRPEGLGPPDLATRPPRERVPLDRLARMTADPDRRVSTVAASALSDLGDRSGDVRELLLGEARDRDSPVRLDALAALMGAWSDRPEVRDLAVIAARDPDPVARSVALARLPAWAVSGDLTDEAVAAIAEGLDDPESRVRQHASLAAGGLGARARPLVPSLIRRLNDSSLSVGYTSAGALGQLGLESEAALPTLRRFLPRAEPGWREGVAGAIRKIERDAAFFRGQILPDLRAELRSSDPRARLRAARALGRFGSPAWRSWADLLRVSGDPDPEVRAAARRALGEILRASARSVGLRPAGRIG